MDNAFDYIQGQMDTRFRATPDDNRPSFGEVVSASVGRAYDPLYEYVKFESNRSTSFREEGFDPFLQIPDHLNDYSSSLLGAHTQEEFDELVTTTITEGFEFLEVDYEFYGRFGNVN